MNPRLSFVIPTYNRATTLTVALDSILAQTVGLDDVEILVSDDASSDDTPRLLDLYRGRHPGVRTFRQATNLGLRHWQFLLGEARGDLVFVLCDDDAVPPDFLAHVLPAFDDPELGLLTGDIRLRGPRFDPLRVLTTPTPVGPADGPTRCREQLRSHHMVMATVYRRSVLTAAGGWDPTVGTHFDCTAYCRSALRSRRTLKLDRPLLEFRISPGSWSHRLTREAQRRLAEWYRRKLDLLRADAAELAPDLEPFLNGMYRGHARTVAIGLETELTLGRLPPADARRALAELTAVFPEASADRVVWKVWACTHLGTGWLRRARRLLGRPEPADSALALFNSFGPAP